MSFLGDKSFPCYPSILNLLTTRSFSSLVQDEGCWNGAKWFWFVSSSLCSCKPHHFSKQSWRSRPAVLLTQTTSQWLFTVWCHWDEAVCRHLSTDDVLIRCWLRTLLLLPPASARYWDQPHQAERMRRHREGLTHTLTHTTQYSQYLSCSFP